MMNTRISFLKFVLVFAQFGAQFGAQVSALVIAQIIVFGQMAHAQTAPGPEEISSYTGLHLAAFDGNINDARALSRITQILKHAIRQAGHRLSLPRLHPTRTWWSYWLAPVQI